MPLIEVDLFHFTVPVQLTRVALHGLRYPSADYCGGSFNPMLNEVTLPLPRFSTFY